MRSPVYVVLLVLLASGAALSFRAEDYLYANESGAGVTYSNFMQDGGNYSLVKINGNGAFLLLNGAPLQDQAKMTQVLHDYYVQTYFPTTAEISQIRDYLVKYNDSKNNGEMVSMRGKEDNACRYNTFIDGHIRIGNGSVHCSDNASCNIAAALLYSAYNEAFGWGSPTQVLEPIKTYAFATYGSEALIAQDFAALDSINEDNVYSNLKSVQDSIAPLRQDESDIETSVFRFPRLDDPDDVEACRGVCYGLCPPLNFDSTQLDGLDSSLVAIISKVTPLASQATTGAAIYASTVARLEKHAEEMNASHYSAIYNPLATSAAATIASAESTTSLIKNSSLQANLSALQDLHSGINASINSRNFNTLDRDLALYRALIPVVNNLSNATFAVYNASMDAKNRADSIAFILDATDLDPLARADADRLKNRTSMLDARFSKGLAEQAYLNLTRNYTDISSQSEALLRQTRENPGSMLLLSFRSFALKINQGLAGTIESAKLMPLNQVPQNKMQTFGLFSLATFLSLGSMCLLVFLSILVLRQFTARSSRYALLVLFLLSVLSVSTFAAFMYIYLDKTSSHADVGEFLADMKARNSSVVLIDTQNASPLAAGPMASCGDSIARTLLAENKTVTLLSLGPSGCTRQSGPGSAASVNVTKEWCIDSLNNASSAILLNYSAYSEVSRFTVIYQNRADIEAGVPYYSSCPLPSLLGK